jgi:hypothetical protein
MHFARVKQAYIMLTRSSSFVKISRGKGEENVISLRLQHLMEKAMLTSKADVRDVVDLESLMDEFSVSDRRLEMAGGSGRPGDVALAAAGSSNPGVNCTGGCN